MLAKVELRPGQKGTKSLVEKYGDALLCVRYRYDEKNGVRLKTVELIVDRKPWKAPVPVFKDTELVPVQKGFTDRLLREQAKAAKGRWNPEERVWYIQFEKIKGTVLDKFIVS